MFYHHTDEHEHKHTMIFHWLQEINENPMEIQYSKYRMFVDRLQSLESQQCAAAVLIIRLVWAASPACTTRQT